MRWRVARRLLPKQGGTRRDREHRRPQMAVQAQKREKSPDPRVGRNGAVRGRRHRLRVSLASVDEQHYYLHPRTSSSPVAEVDGLLSLGAASGNRCVISLARCSALTAGAANRGSLDASGPSALDCRCRGGCRSQAKHGPAVGTAVDPRRTVAAEQTDPRALGGRCVASTRRRHRG
jgi:hypothetical protein